MNEKRGAHLLTAAVLGLALCASGCSKKVEKAEGPKAAGGPKAFFSAVPIGGGEIVREKVNVSGEMIEISHSKLDMGPPENMFDNDPQTFVRTERANPAVVDLDFPTPRTMKGVSVTTRFMETGLAAKVTSVGSADQKIYSKKFHSLSPVPTVQLDFDAGTGPVRKLSLEITKLDGSDGHIHIVDIHFN